MRRLPLRFNLGTQSTEIFLLNIMQAFFTDLYGSDRRKGVKGEGLIPSTFLQGWEERAEEEQPGKRNF